ncbi:unnamed protein product [Pieris macdunnoughi]|uniref:Uncharacterized protein n=1 Tax=Pieris macdunnoughi TaxID=345717 RepID=A0A821MSS0_9NEOP|nr:unnamed protein product [Pieris macdunnoughi]
MVYEVRVFAETLAKFRVWKMAQLVEELEIEAGRRRGTRVARAPRARTRTALRRDPPARRTSARPPTLPLSSLYSFPQPIKNLSAGNQTLRSTDLTSLHTLIFKLTP